MKTSTVLCVTCQLSPSRELSPLGFLTPAHIRSTSPDRDSTEKEQEKLPVLSSIPGKVDTRKEELDFAIEMLEPSHLVGLSGSALCFMAEQREQKGNGHIITTVC